MELALRLAESGRLPEPVLRWGIRRLLQRRLRQESLRRGGDAGHAKADWLRVMRDSPIAPAPSASNDQHYEVPAAFYELVLGRHLKYSSGFWDDGTSTLDDAEARMLALTCERAELVDGQSVLELGCGWGSLSLWMAQQYPNSRIVSVSNAPSQRRYVNRQIEARGIANLEVRTADMNDFDTPLRFDRVVSVEMFEHMRNWETLLSRIERWLAPDGRLFLHFFAHREHAYPFLDEGDADWMARHFFTGGMMPSHDLPTQLESALGVEDCWIVDGHHYGLTSEAWAARMDANRAALLPVLAATYGHDEAGVWFQRWKMFFLACAELFHYRDGLEWWVSHYRLGRHDEIAAPT